MIHETSMGRTLAAIKAMSDMLDKYGPVKDPCDEMAIAMMHERIDALGALLPPPCEGCWDHHEGACRWHNRVGDDFRTITTCMRCERTDCPSYYTDDELPCSASKADVGVWWQRRNKANARAERQRARDRQARLDTIERDKMRAQVASRRAQRLARG